MKNYIIQIFGCNIVGLMSEDRMVKKICKWKPMLTRPLGRPNKKK
jgi:hypothetical protein